MANVDYRIRIYKHDSEWAVPTVPEVEYTFLSTSGDIATLGDYGGQNIRPLEGRAEARTWSVGLLDRSNQITTKLGDTDGVNDIAARMLDISEDVAGGGFTVVATGRIGDVTLVDTTEFELEVVDEFARVRGTPYAQELCNTQVFPPSIRLGTAQRHNAPYYRSSTASIDEVFGAEVTAVTNNSNFGHNVARIIFKQTVRKDKFIKVNKKVVDTMREDAWRISPTSSANVEANPETGLKGSFNTLRLYLRAFGGSGSFTEYEVIRLGHHVMWTAEDWDNGLAVPNDFFFAHVGMFVEVADPGNTLSVSQSREGYLLMPTHAPTNELPYWILNPFTATLGFLSGIDTFTWIKDRFDELNIRYESNVAFSEYHYLTNPNGLINNPAVPRMRARLTRPIENFVEWVTEHVFKPLGIIAFQNSAGEIAPRLIRQPSADLISDTANLFEFTEAKIHSDYPSWMMTEQEMATVVNVKYYAPSIAEGTRVFDLNSEIKLKDQTYEGPNDGMEPVENTETFEDPLAERFGQRAIDFDLMGFFAEGGWSESTGGEHDRAFRARIASETFLRVASGTILTEFTGTLATVGVEPGDWVLVNVDEFPNLVGGGQRGGARVMQVLEKWYHDAGFPRFRLWDAGPSLQPLSAPGLAAVKSSSDGFHTIDVTASSLTGDSWTLEINVSATDPSDSDADWIRINTYPAATTQVSITPIASGTKYYFRARQNAVGRIASGWSTHPTATTDTLSAPTGLGEDLVDRTSAVLEWTTAEPGYPIEVEVYETVSGDVIYNEIIKARYNVDPNRFDANDLTPSTGYSWRVRHVDEYGGVGTWASDSFTTSGGAAGSCPDIRGVFVLVGSLQGREVSN